MRALRILRTGFEPQTIAGLVLARDLRDDAGRIAFAKGAVLGAADGPRLTGLAWEELHVVAPEDGDLHERDAGERLARVAAGPGVRSGALSGGHWPLSATHRGIVRVKDDALRALNDLDGVAVYTLYDGQVVDTAELVGRAKIVPFVIGAAVVAEAENIGRRTGGVVGVQPFGASTVGAVVQESLGAAAMERFRDVLREKVTWFGSRLVDPRFVSPEAPALADALSGVLTDGANVVVLAGSRPMDPLDPSFEALNRLGAIVERRGVPAHPGSLLWLAWVGDVPVIGMPSCGLFSRATVFDLVLPRLLAGERVDSTWLGSLGHGGFLTRDMAFRFPPYRPAHERGEVV